MTQETKKCSKCGEIKPVSAFYKKSDKKDKLSSLCKSCDTERSRKWRIANPEKARESVRKWKIANPERAREPAEQVSKRIRRWYAANRDKQLKNVGKWYATNRERQLENVRRWRAAHPEKSLKQKHARRARKLGNGGKITATEWRKLKEFYDYTCLCCGRREPEIKLEPDHVMPLKLGGKNVIENIQPLCASCNRSKQAKHIDYRRARLLPSSPSR